MKNSVITFGIVLSMALSTSIYANDSVKGKESKKESKIVTTTIKDVAPISIAVAQSDIETVIKFLEFGADIEVKTEVNGMTPLMYAARYNNVEMINLLINNGADVNATSKLGYTAFQYAELAGANDAATLLK